ncbi:MAG: transposase [Acidobacteria bacterium]|nr:transposase [Acidobacteriota bacterium]MBU4307450.1 transposase [Acidobacteriota bacterium]MBU4405125.1 transposase [Acidobacteriota bacterium]MCG2812119.1 transposase [Candidatus Aminicenantes bacterium]
MIHQRKYMRLHGWDYSSPGCYFVTICVKNKECFLADVVNGKVVPNEFGKIVESRWEWLRNQYRYLELDAFVVMPNHVHGLVKIIPNSVVTGRDLSLQTIVEKIKSLSDIIGAFKTTSSKDIHLAGFLNFYWQRSFYEKIIRFEQEANAVCQYIRNNSLNWEQDEENPGKIIL